MDHHGTEKTGRRYLAGIVLPVSALLLTLTSCTTLMDAQGADKQEGAVDASAIGGATQATPKPLPASNEPMTIDQSLDDWEKARAIYLRSLDYAQIEQQKNPHAEYKMKSDLTESQYHISIAQTAMLVEHDWSKSLQELQSAELQFSHALHQAAADELPALRQAKKPLDDLVRQASLSHALQCASPQAESFHEAEAGIEDLLAMR